MVIPPNVNLTALPVVPAGTSIQTMPETSGEKVERAIAIGSELATRFQLITMDNRYVGGAFWVEEDGSSFEVHRVLKKAGFIFKAEQGYWIK